MTVHTAGAVNLDPVADVDEGNNFQVCVNLICTGGVLGCPLTVTLNVIDNAKTGQYNCQTLCNKKHLVMTTKLTK